jgi:excisionase family DNA binding protein
MLLKETEERDLLRLQAQLTKSNVGPASKKSVQIERSQLKKLLGLLSNVLASKPLVVDEYLTPNDAAKIAGISRPVITEMLKNGTLLGHKVKSHWRVRKESLIAYITQRDTAFRAASSVDQDGFGI